MLRKNIRNSVVLDADKITRKAYKDRSISKNILDEFNTKNRKIIAGIVFNDRRRLKILNKIIHPFVIKEINKTIREGKKHIILDVPLLFQTRLDKICDAVIIVRCNRPIRIKRLRRKGFDIDEIKKRTEMQSIKNPKKSRKMVYIIDNSDSRVVSEQQVKKIIRKLMI